MITWLAVKAALTKVWEWLKKYWMWIFFPIGLLFVVVRFLPLLKKSPAVLAPELVGASETADNERMIAEAKAKEAAKVRAQELEAVETKHGQAVKEVVDKQRAESDSLQEDLEQLNAYLKQTGKDVRRGK